MSFFLGIDFGTTGVRSGLFDSEGRLLAIAKASHGTLCPQPSWAEQEPEGWWRGCAATLADRRHYAFHQDG